MTLWLFAILTGIALLVWGADRTVSGAAALARNLGVTPLLIGLTIVGIGTSSPEILVSATAALQGNPGLAIGNSIGSNIANIGLVLGITAVITPLAVHSDVLRKEYPLLLAVSILAWLLLSDLHLGRVDGLVLLAGLILVSLILVRIGRARSPSDPMTADYDAKIPQDIKTGTAIGWIVLGLGVLLASSRLLIWGAINIAQAFGISDLIVGLTIVAVGTSLPELAASVASALKRQHDIAIGNVIGSNLYNVLAVLCVPGLLAPSAIAEEVLQRDLPIMLALIVALYLLGSGFGGQGRINRFEGLLLASAFFAYQGWLIFESTDDTLMGGA
jgi:cation:H+ antiporter